MLRQQRMIPAALIAAPLIALAIATCSKPATQENATTAVPEDSIARGRYLVTISGCNDCHTPGYLYGVPDTTRLLSGSEVGWQGPWGVSYARNLTPDSTTGIGTWTSEQIVNAIRAGLRPDGSPIPPAAMPWQGLLPPYRQGRLRDRRLSQINPGGCPTGSRHRATGEEGDDAGDPVPGSGKWDAPHAPPRAAPRLAGGKA
jgi:mono/diheme cytochrome c family protein